MTTERGSVITKLGLSAEDVDELRGLFGGGVYSDQEILWALEADHIVIDPLNRDFIKGSSVDVTLAADFYLTDKIGGQAHYNPRDPADVKRYFVHKQAITHREWSDGHKGTHFENIGDDDLIIVLGPHERILASTQEFIGIHAPGTSEMRARSTTGRNGKVVCKDAGWGDPGYINRWTMEVQNDNGEATPLVVGERIAQIVFHHTGPVLRSYGDGGKYQSGSNIEAI
jgi:deoxycytidine triphosphate deaminase